MYQRKKMDKVRMYVRGKVVLILLAVLATMIVCSSTSYVNDCTDAEQAVTEVEEAQTPEVVTVVCIPAREVETVKVFNVPLDVELQLFIISECEDYHIDPAIIVAMAQRESQFNPDAIGDGGDSFGLMQIQPKWHQDRMNRLGVTDLMNPYQNVTVAIDYLAELIDRGKGIEWALAAYNAGATGANNGYGQTYAKAVLAIAEETGVIECEILH